MEEIKILILDDEKDYADEMVEFLKMLEYDVVAAYLPSAAFKILKRKKIDIMILDIKLPEMDGLSVLEKVKKEYPDIEVIMISGHGDMITVIESLRLGALDYIKKPFGALEIKSAILRSKKFITLNTNYKDMKEKFSAASYELRKIFGHDIIGNSEAMQFVVNMMSKVAQTDDTSVLITGESGTGKELVARGIHYLSARKDKYFYDVNCSSIPDSLAESELFGHSKGAFTGATANKSGWFETANSGTLFLDEIGDMPIAQQTKLLRALEQRKIRKVGSSANIDIDVRIIAATNQNLKDLIEEKKFRLDLYHRLNSFTINIPPLRERTEDIPLLLEYFVKDLSKKLRKKVTKIDEKIILKLMQYSFPGNVRELKNMVEKALIISNSSILTLKDFAFSQIEKNGDIAENTEKIYNLEILEKNAILEVMKITKYKSHAAKLLNITPQALDRRLIKYNLT